MQIPVGLDVQGTWFQVVIRKESEEPELVGAEGLCQPNRGQIVINANLSPSRHLDVLIHEIAHAVAHTSGFGWSLKKLIGDARAEEVEELLCSVFIPAYVATLRMV